jgi:hypothetical protein
LGKRYLKKAMPGGLFDTFPYSGSIPRYDITKRYSMNQQLKTSAKPNLVNSPPSDPLFLEVSDQLSDKGFFVAAADDLNHLGAHRLLDVDDFWSGLLRCRDDANVDAALRRRALWLRAPGFAEAV